MNTTTFFVEILISGILASTWLMLSIAGFVGHERFLAVLRGSPEVFALAVISLSYAIGVIFDRFWDSMTKRFDRVFRRKSFTETGEIDRVRIKLFHLESDIHSYIDYIRSRMRIARAAACNMPLIGIASLLTVVQQAPEIGPLPLIGLCLIAALLSLVSIASFRKLSQTYYRQLALVDEYVLKQQSQVPEPKTAGVTPLPLQEPRQ